MNHFRFNPLKFLCACCSKSCTIKQSQKKAHIIHCKHCLLKPFICSKCRWSRGKKNLTNTCVWCQTTGTLHSMHSFSCVEMNVRAADSWQFFQEKNTNLAKLSHINRSIFTNWRRFLESQQMVRCDFVTYSSYEKSLRINFFQTWMQFQIFQSVDSQKMSVVYFQTKISKKFFDILKTITFTRMLVSNLFGNPSLKSISEKMRNIVCRHFFSNFAVLFELLLKSYC
jgi:hypothetical protein